MRNCASGSGPSDHPGTTTVFVAWAPAKANCFSAPDDDADHVRCRKIFLLDRRARRRAIFRRQQSALLGEAHPAIAPPVRQHAVVIDEVVALLGGGDARMRL